MAKRKWFQDRQFGRENVPTSHPHQQQGKLGLDRPVDTSDTFDPATVSLDQLEGMAKAAAESITKVGGALDAMTRQALDISAAAGHPPGLLAEPIPIHPTQLATNGGAPQTQLGPNAAWWSSPAPTQLAPNGTGPQTQLVPNFGQPKTQLAAGLEQPASWPAGMVREPEQFGPPKSLAAPDQDKMPGGGLGGLLNDLMGTPKKGKRSTSDEVADAMSRVGGFGGGGVGGMPQGGGGNMAALGKMVSFGEDVAGAMAGDPMSMARAAQKVEQEISGKMENLGDAATAMPKAMWQAAQHQEVGKVGSAMMGGAKDTMHSMSEVTKGPFGLDTPLSKLFEAGEKVAGFGKAVFDAFQAVRDWTTGLHEANMQFAEYSGAMAQVQAQQEVRQIQLDRERGNRRAEDARALAESKNRLDRTLAPIEDLWGNLMNKLGTLTNNLLANAIQGLGFKADDGDFGTNGLGQEMIETAARRGWVDQFGYPPDERIGPHFPNRPGD